LRLQLENASLKKLVADQHLAPVVYHDRVCRVISSEKAPAEKTSITAIVWDSRSVVQSRDGVVEG